MPPQPGHRAGAELGAVTVVEVRDPGTTAAVPRRHVEVAGWNGPFLDAVLARVRPGDVVLTLGAGDVTALAPQLVAALEERAGG